MTVFFKYFLICFFAFLSKAYTINTLAPISTADDLHTYINEYTKKSLKLFLENNENKKVQTKDIPSLRIAKPLKKDFHDSSYARMKELINDKKSFSLLDNDVRMYHYLDPITEEQIKHCETYFHNYLLKNNEEYFPNYHSIISQINEQAKIAYQEAYEYFNNLKKNELTAHEIAKWMGIKSFTNKDKEFIIEKTEAIVNDLNRLVVNTNFFIKNTDTVQLFDMYLFAEDSFKSLLYMKSEIRDITHVKSNTLTDNNLKINGFNVKILNIDKAPSYEDLEKFFSHRQFPIRSYYLNYRSIAFLMKDFANSFRAKLGLQEIPNSIFEQTNELEAALEIDLTLPDIELVIQRIWDRSETEWLKNTAADFSHKKPNYIPLKKKKKKCPRPHRRNNNNYLKSDAAENAEQVKFKNQLFHLIHDDEKLMLDKLFKDESITCKEIRTIFQAVYRALVNLNQAKKAAQFLTHANNAGVFAFQGKLSTAAKKSSIRPFIVLNIVPQEFIDTSLVTQSLQSLNDADVQEGLFIKRGRPLDRRGYRAWKKMLENYEVMAREVAVPDEQAALLMSLAHAWHQLYLALSVRTALVPSKKEELFCAKKKIKNLLHEVQPYYFGNIFSPTLLDAYLFSFYLKQELSFPNNTLSDERVLEIQQGAYESLARPARNVTIPKVDERGNFIESYKLSDSIFHAITNRKLGRYIVVNFSKSIQEKEIPLFIQFQGVTYRTDVFGGSRLKAKPSENDFGSLIGVSLEAGDFFRRWLTSEESFWYGQRAFMPEDPEGNSKSVRGDFIVATVPDEDEFSIKDEFIVRDGFGYIKASLARELGLFEHNREVKALRNIAFQALQGYDSVGNKAAAKELFAAGKIRANEPLSENINVCTNKYMCTAPKMIAVGMPVAKDTIILPNTPEWREFASEGVLIGRNPYSAKRLQRISQEQIKFSDTITQLQDFQYTLTGFYKDANEQIIGSFFKGMLGVIDDVDWPEHYRDADMLVPSKDQKLNQTWKDDNQRKNDQSVGTRFTFRGILLVKQEFARKYTAGLPAFVAENLAGDYDGDEYDFISSKDFPHLSNLVEQEKSTAIPNPKIKKVFTPRQNVGNFSRIMNLRKPLLAVWVNIANRFYYLPKDEREQFAQEMSQSLKIEKWMGNDWLSELNISSNPVDLVTAEIQLGIKFGEDIFKTSVNVQSVMKRASEYEHVLRRYGSPLYIPYGKQLKKMFEENKNLSEALKPALETQHSANLVDKAFRALARYSQEKDDTLEYVSDDE